MMAPPPLSKSSRSCHGGGGGGGAVGRWSGPWTPRARPSSGTCEDRRAPCGHAEGALGAGQARPRSRGQAKGCVGVCARPLHGDPRRGAGLTPRRRHGVPVPAHPRLQAHVHVRLACRADPLGGRSAGADRSTVRPGRNGRRRQPNAETWARQLQLWGEMVLAYCRHHRIYNLDLQEALAGPLFRNDKIGRACDRRSLDGPPSSAGSWLSIRTRHRARLSARSRRAQQRHRRRGAEPLGEARCARWPRRSCGTLVAADRAVCACCGARRARQRGVGPQLARPQPLHHRVAHSRAVGRPHLPHRTTPPELLPRAGDGGLTRSVRGLASLRHPRRSRSTAPTTQC